MALKFWNLPVIKVYSVSIFVNILMYLVFDKLREKVWCFSLVNEHMISDVISFSVLDTIGGNLRKGFSYQSKKLKILVIGIGENESKRKKLKIN